MLGVEIVLRPQQPGFFIRLVGARRVLEASGGLPK